MEDKLDVIFAMQKTLNERIKIERNLQFSKEEWMQKQSLALIAEMGELLDEVNYKWWKNPKEINDANLKEELVDVFHFFVSLCLTAGMDASELHNIYMSKNKENHDRQSGVSAKQGYKP